MLGLPAVGPSPRCSPSLGLARRHPPRNLAGMPDRACPLQLPATAGCRASLISTGGVSEILPENARPPTAPTLTPLGRATPVSPWELGSQAPHCLLWGRSVNFPASVSLPVPPGLTQSESNNLRSLYACFSPL